MAKKQTPLTPQERANVLRETFEAMAAVGFMKWKAEELALGYKVTAEDRPDYVKELEKIMWSDLQRMAAHTPDARLLDAREYWLDKADKMGLREWQRVLSQGRGGEPFYEEIGREIKARNAKLSDMGRPQQPEQPQAPSQGLKPKV
jgi:hypothetical protein